MILLLSLFLSGVWVRAAHAAGITVTTTTDEAPADPDNGECSLREALHAANTNTAVDSCAAGDGGNTDTITLASGATYSLVFNGSGEDANANGDLDITDTGNTATIDVILDVASGGTATISQDALITSDRVLHVLSGAGVEINDIIITGGSTADFGGGIYTEGVLTLTDVIVTGNQADSGGGIYVAAGTTTLDSGTVSGNTAAATLNSGGGIYVNSSATLIVQNGSTIGGDTAGETNSAEFGGGITNVGTTTIDGSIISGNAASNSGGGIYNVAGSVTITSSTVSGNTAEGDGGGLYNVSGTLTVESSSTIGGDTAGEANSAAAGGGIFVYDGTATIDASTVSGNSADYGGGILVNPFGTASVKNGSTISDNTAAIQGGGINTVGILTVKDSALLRNTAANTGGAVYSSNNNINTTRISGSCIVANSTTAVFNAEIASQVAMGNWWGAPGGPNTTGADTISGTWSAGNFLTSPPFPGCSDHLIVQGSGDGIGSGTMVDSAPGSTINCAWNGINSGDCDQVETSWADTGYAIVAAPGSASDFSGWTGCDTTSTTTLPGDTCHVTLASDPVDTTVTAEFNAQPVLTVAGSGTGLGNMSATGILCVWNGTSIAGDCTQQAANGTAFSITADPNPGTTFAGWTGCDTTSGTDDEICELTLDADMTVTASFTRDCYTLTTAVNPLAGGSVTVNTAQNCTGGYLYDTIVQMTAYEDPNYDFVDWSGDVVADWNPVDFLMDGDKSVTANFVRDNLIENGSFEFAMGWLPDNWTGKKLELGATGDGIDCGESTEGGCSMHFVADKNGDKLIQEIAHSGSQGDEYSLTFDTMTSGVGSSGATKVMVKLFYTDGKKGNFKVKLLPGTNAWDDVQIDITAAKNYTKIQLIIQISRKSGTVWFDNFVLFAQ